MGTCTCGRDAAWPGGVKVRVEFRVRVRVRVRDGARGRVRV